MERCTDEMKVEVERWRSGGGDGEVEVGMKMER